MKNKINILVLLTSLLIITTLSSCEKEEEPLKKEVKEEPKVTKTYNRQDLVNTTWKMVSNDNLTHYLYFNTQSNNNGYIVNWDNSVFKYRSKNFDCIKDSLILTHLEYWLPSITDYILLSYRQSFKMEIKGVSKGDTMILENNIYIRN